MHNDIGKKDEQCKYIYNEFILDFINMLELFKKDFILINKSTFEIYNNNDVIINTNIRNGMELFLITYSEK